LVREEVTREEARRRIEEINEPYKLEILDGIKTEPITIYRIGEPTIDKLILEPQDPVNRGCRHLGGYTLCTMMSETPLFTPDGFGPLATRFATALRVL
jgi:hypothetical protein